MHDLPLIRSANQLRSRVRSWRAFGETVALAPMQGGVHDGHLALIRRARRDWDRALAVIFQDPLDRPEGMADDDSAARIQERGDGARMVFQRRHRIVRAAVAEARAVHERTGRAAPAAELELAAAMRRPALGAGRPLVRRGVAAENLRP